MNLFNKYESVGIFFSVVVMAIALSIIRFKTDVFIANNYTLQNNSQGAVIAVSQEDSKVGGVSLEQALQDSFSLEKSLQKLIVDDVRIGSGVEVKNGDTLVVNYVGTLQDGTKFDSSYDRGKPFTLTIGEGRVIQGWEKGLIGMRVGGYRVLVIPSEMGYGDDSAGIIPPNSPLVFGVELLEIR